MTVAEYLEIEEIKKVRSLYSHYYDSNDLDSLVSLFTEDAVCEWDLDHGGTWKGIEEIRQRYHQWSEKFGNREFIVMHAVTNPWIELTGPDTAEGRWFLIDLNFTDSHVNPLRTAGIYDDEYKKINGIWKIRRTRLDFLWPKRHIKGGTPGKRLP